MSNRGARQWRNPVVGAVVRGLHRFNARHPWDHNEFWHRWIRRRVPRSRCRALDVGCGTGLLAGRLATRCDDVLAIDIDGTMISQAQARLGGLPRVAVKQQSFAEVTGTFDVITFVASLHHMPLDGTLTRVAQLLAPGGRLLVVGLARSGSAIDVVYDIASAFLNPIVGLLKHPRPVRSCPEPNPMPVSDPALTFDQIAETARHALPGAQARRRLFFRYTLVWEKPAVAA